MFELLATTLQDIIRKESKHDDESPVTTFFSAVGGHSPQGQRLMGILLNMIVTIVSGFPVVNQDNRETLERLRRALETIRKLRK